MSRKNRKRKLEVEEQSMVDWEQENIFPDDVRNEMESMWEIPQIFHFLYLTKEALNIPHLSMYEMERMLLIPRASKQLANIMTSLLSSPIIKAKLRKIPPMPYEFWTNILAHKMRSWFKVYEGKHRDPVKVLETVGVEPEFWNVFTDASLLDGRDFEELSFRQRVWLLKTVCDTVMHTRKTVQEEMSKQPWDDQFETVLGTDRCGARYIYFPQFLKSDLRVYRHCLDNKILSTVKPIKPKVPPTAEIKTSSRIDVPRRKMKTRKRKSRWCNGLSSKPKRSVNKPESKGTSDCKCSSDSATGSLINDDTNMSSTSNCSNNNHISLHTINGKRSRSLSKASEVSTMSTESRCRTTRSSGYDTNSSFNVSNDKKSSQKMFKGFSNNSNGKCNIEIISGILNGLKTNQGEERDDEEVDESLVHSSQARSNSSRQFLDADDIRVRDESTERSMDNLSSSSKTDDEKLNEIIGAEGTKLNEKSEKLNHISSSSKSDDEKLSERKTSVVDRWSESKSDRPIKEEKKEEVESSTSSRVKTESSSTERSSRRRQNVQSRSKTSGSKVSSETVQSETAGRSESPENEFEEEEEEEEEEDLSLSELRSLLQREAMRDDFSFDEQSESGYNLRKPKDEKAAVRKQEVEDFNQLLSDLGVSEFQLVADSVDSLKELISSFAQKSEDSNAKEEEPPPPCEVKLVKKMEELLSSLKQMESSLRDSMKKARGKLQKEWTNFKEGSVEDQDSSGEGGLGSNWWVLGSQGCPLPTPGDATLQTLPLPALSPVGAQNQPDKSEESQEEPAGGTEQTRRVKQGVREQNDCQEGETRGRSENEEDGQSQEGPRIEIEGKGGKEEEQQSRRVLRARGVSSYTEQFYSDDEIEENELEEWTDVEAVYAAPGTQAGPSTPHAPPKVRYSDDWSNQEDSDQDWILPSSRKRKNKRPSANRRLKSFQHKLQNIKVDTSQDGEPSATGIPQAPKMPKEKPKVKETKVCRVKKPVNPQTPSLSTPQSQETAVESEPQRIVPSTETVCKVEAVDSVHSELDIKDEGPIFDTIPNHFESSYASMPQNYVMLKADHNPMNYYVMQPSPGAGVIQQSAAIVQPAPVVSSILPPIQQGYYVQGGQNYIIHNPQPSFISPHQATFQPQGPQMMAPQQFISHPGYVPYMVSAPQPQASFVTTDMPRTQVLTQEIRPTPTIPLQGTRPPVRFHGRLPVPRHNYPHPNGAVIRSSMPIRGNFPRPSSAKQKNPSPQRGYSTKVQKPRQQVSGVAVENAPQKTTSLIVLSDSDDEIEMIITEKKISEAEGDKTQTIRRNSIQSTQNPVTPSEMEAASSKGVIPPQIIQRMSQGGISITPVKPAAPVHSANTQLVVVVNETGSHYALALPNGSKLILTPEQVAQIRASNGGKLIL